MWGDLPAVWEAPNPAAVFAAAYGQAFLDVDPEPTEPIDYEKRTQLWAWQKLARFPEGLSRKKLWNDAPKSITREVDRFTFDRYLDSAIESGFIFGGEGEPLTQNPDLSPE